MRNDGTYWGLRKRTDSIIFLLFCNLRRVVSVSFFSGIDRKWWDAVGSGWRDVLKVGPFCLPCLGGGGVLWLSGFASVPLPNLPRGCKSDWSCLFCIMSLVGDLSEFRVCTSVRLPMCVYLFIYLLHHGSSLKAKADKKEREIKKMFVTPYKNNRLSERSF